VVAAVQVTQVELPVRAHVQQMVEQSKRYQMQEAVLPILDVAEAVAD
jgi:hypothetical protein